MEPMTPHQRPDKGCAHVCLAGAGESYWIPGGNGCHAEIQLGAEHGSNFFSAGTLTVPAGGTLPERCYARGDALYFVFAGRGVAVLDDASSPIEPWSTVMVGHNTRHTFRQTGAEDLVLLWFGLPPGPERLLRRIGVAREAGAAHPPAFTAEQVRQARAEADWHRGPTEIVGGLTHSKGPSLVLGPEDGASYWQPTPGGGYITVKVSPFNYPTNMFAFGIQQIDAGKFLYEHSHMRHDETKVVIQGRPTAWVEAQPVEMPPGSLVFEGRWINHGFDVPADRGPMTITWLMAPAGLENVLVGIGRPRAPGDRAHPGPFPRPADMAEILEEAAFGPRGLKT